VKTLRGIQAAFETIEQYAADVSSVFDRVAEKSNVLDVYIPTTDGRELVLTRYTEPEREIKLLLERLDLELPAHPPPRITAGQADPASPM
jgi:hypothetical protein